MPLITNTYENIEKGVYKVEYMSISDEMKRPERWPHAKAYLRYYLPELDREVTYSVDVGEDLSQAIRVMTGNILKYSGDDHRLFREATEALSQASWTGLIRIGKDGWPDQLQVPPGPHRFQFINIKTRDEYNLAKSIRFEASYGTGEFVIYWAEVAEGSYQGFRHRQWLKTSYKVLANGDLAVNDKSALWRLLTAAGVTGEDFADVSLDPNTSPMPQIEAALMTRSQSGASFHGTVDENGQLNWNTLQAAGNTGSAPVSLTDEQGAAVPNPVPF